MSAASSPYAQAFAKLPAELRDSRREAWQRFEQLGFPTRKQEDWKYTDLSALNSANYALEASASFAAASPALNGWDALRFINGHRESGQASAPSATLVDDSVSALNAALVRDGLDLRIGRNQQNKPLLLTLANGGGGMSHLRHRLHLESGAEATVLLDLRSDGSDALSTSVFEIELEANARLRLLRIQDLGDKSTDLTRTEVHVQRDAHFDYVGLDLGGSLVRHDLNVFLDGPGAATDVHGVFAPGGRSRFDTHTRIHHVAPHTTSREIFRGLVRDKANAVFNGKIVVHKDAQKTDSEQNVATLLLAPGAQINAKPELEIYADDVKCAHGATCGQLDEMAVYYLRSRGLDMETARNVLLYTFAHSVLSHVGDEQARNEMQRRLLTRLPGAQSLDELA